MSVLRVVLVVMAALLKACSPQISIARSSLIIEISRNERGLWESMAFVERSQSNLLGRARSSDSFKRVLKAEKSDTCREGSHYADSFERLLKADESDSCGVGSTSIDAFMKGLNITPSCDPDFTMDEQARKVINMGENGEAIDSGHLPPKSKAFKGYSFNERIIEGVNYVLFHNRTTWATAYCVCKSQKLHLAVPNSVEQNLALKDWWIELGKSDGECIYLGFTDMQERGVFRPVADDKFFNYTWAPANLNGNGGCACLSRDGLISNTNCEELFSFICQHYGQ